MRSITGNHSIIWNSIGLRKTRYSSQRFYVFHGPYIRGPANRSIGRRSAGGDGTA